MFYTTLSARAVHEMLKAAQVTVSSDHQGVTNILKKK